MTSEQDKAQRLAAAIVDAVLDQKTEAVEPNESTECRHETAEATLVLQASGGRWTVDVRIVCNRCLTPFVFEVPGAKPAPRDNGRRIRIPITPEAR